MGATTRAWFFQLFDKYRGVDVDDDAGQVLVLNPGLPTAPTIYSDASGTSAVSNAVRTPRTFSNGVIRFWTDVSVTSVDLVVMTAKGQSYFIEDVSNSVGHIAVYPTDRNFTLILPFGASNATEVDTGMDFPANCRLSGLGVSLLVTTIDTTETVDVGILSSESGGDADGFIVLASVATAGYVQLVPQITGGTTIDFVGTNFVGALLATSIAGSDSVAAVGGWTPKQYVTNGTAKSITYTGSAGSDTAAGYIYLDYVKLPS